MAVKISDIIDGMEMQSDTASSYFNKKTGKIVLISEEEMHAAENEESIDDFPDWQQDSIKTAQEIIEANDYIPLPSQFDIHEYNIMEKFCYQLKMKDSVICYIIQLKAVKLSEDSKIKSVNII